MAYNSWSLTPGIGERAPVLGAGVAFAADLS